VPRQTTPIQLLFRIDKAVPHRTRILTACTLWKISAIHDLADDIVTDPEALRGARRLHVQDRVADFEEGT